LNVDLLLYKHELAHFVPEADSYSDEWKNYTKQLKWGNYFDLIFYPKKKIKADLAQYDILIGSRLAPAFVAKINRKLDIFVPSGGDIWTVPFFSGWDLKNLGKFLFASQLQKKGIASTDFILFDETNEEVETKINSLVFHGKRIFSGPPMLYTPNYNPESILTWREKSPLFERFKKIRDENELVIFHHVKHLWKEDSIKKFDIHQAKGNDRLFRAFKQFLDENKGLKACIITFNFGIDNENSKKLIRDLGISENVHWFDLSKRRDVLIGLSMADLMAGEFVNSWFSYGTIYEAMTVGVPIMHNRKDELYPSEKEKYPMFPAETEEEILNHLRNYLKNPQHFKQVGKQAMEWFNRVAIGESVKRINEAVEICAARK
jgi:hypothetical protein